MYALINVRIKLSVEACISVFLQCYVQTLILFFRYYCLKLEI